MGEMSSNKHSNRWNTEVSDEQLVEAALRRAFAPAQDDDDRFSQLLKKLETAELQDTSRRER